jgi:hypothetical protein
MMVGKKTGYMIKETVCPGKNAQLYLQFSWFLSFHDYDALSEIHFCT